MLPILDYHLKPKSKFRFIYNDNKERIGKFLSAMNIPTISVENINNKINDKDGFLWVLLIHQNQ